MSKLFSSPGVLGNAVPTNAKEQPELDQNRPEPAPQNIVRLPDPIESIEPQPDDECVPESGTVVDDVHVLKTIQHVEELPQCPQMESDETADPLFVQFPGWKKPIPLDKGYSLVKFAGRHNTRAAVQRRYQVRKSIDPVRHAKHKAYYRSYMKRYQQKIKMKKTKDMIANAIARMQLGRKRSILQANESLSVATPAPVVPPLPACSDEPQSVATTAPELPSLPACSDQTLLDSPTIALHVDDNMQSSADPDFTEVFVPVKKKRRKASYLMILPSVKASQERQKRRKKKAMKKKAVHRTPSSTVSAPPDSPVELGLSEAEKKKAERRLQLLQVQTPISGVQCPFDRVLEPQRAIDWYQERVGHLEESLEQAIHLNLKDFIPPNGPRSKPVTMSTAQFFGEDGRNISPPNSPRKPGVKYGYESSDTEGSVDISHMPVVVNRARSGSESSTWADYDSAGVLSDGQSDIDAGRTDISDQYARHEYTREDYRNLGMGYLGPTVLRNLRKKASRSYMDTMLKTEVWFDSSSARFAKFPDDSKDDK